MKALVLAGGRGTRLRPQVSDVPKPMADVAGRPFLEWQVALLRRHGIEEIVFSIGYKGSVIRDHFGDGSGFGIEASYVWESEPLGTGGAVKKAESALRDDEPFLVVNGDTYLDLAVDEFVRFHRRRSERATLALVRVDETKTGGFVEVENGRVGRFVRERRDGGLVNGGIHLFDQSVLDRMPPRTKFSLEETIEELVTDASVAGFVTDGYFKDIGTPDRYREINEELPAIADQPGLPEENR